MRRVAMPTTVTTPMVTTFQPTSLASHHTIAFYPAGLVLTSESLTAPLSRPYTYAVPDPASAVLFWLMTPGISEPITFIEDLIRRPTWQRYGAWRGVDVETFMPSVGGNFNRARALCRGCTVSRECLDFALADEDIIGMWAGTTAPERKQMRAGRGAA
jgi:WhiB family redox-sensing transcriptional regulator